MTGGRRRTARGGAAAAAADRGADEPRRGGGSGGAPGKRRRGSGGGDHGRIRLMDVSLGTLLGLGLGFLALLLVSLLVYNYRWGSKEEDAAVRKVMRVVTPLPAPKMMELPQVKWISNTE